VGVCVEVLVRVREEVMAALPVPVAVPDPVGLGRGLEVLEEVGVFVLVIRGLGVFVLVIRGLGVFVMVPVPLRVMELEPVPVFEGVLLDVRLGVPVCVPDTV